MRTAMIALGFSFCFGIGAAHAAMVARDVAYDVDGKKMQSVLVYDDAVKTARPGLVMTPDWLGMNKDQVALAQKVAGKVASGWRGGATQAECAHPRWPATKPCCAS